MEICDSNVVTTLTIALNTKIGAYDDCIQLERPSWVWEDVKLDWAVRDDSELLEVDSMKPNVLNWR